MSSVKTIPARRTRSHPPKLTIKAEDPDLLIPIELSQSRAESDLIQDLRGDLPVVSPRESHQSEETLPTVPLGQFQAQRSDTTTTNSIAHSQTDTPSQSEMNSTIAENIVENIVTSQTDTPSQREIFSETGTITSSSEDATHSDGSHLRNIYSTRECNQSTGRPVLAVVLPGPQHPPKVKYFPVTITFTITVLIARPIHPPKVK